VLLVAGMMLLAVPQGAAAVTWDDGAGGGDPRLWNAPANWNPDGVPTAADDVDLETSGLTSMGNPVHINSAATCNNIGMAYNNGTAAYLEINADFDIKGSFTRVIGKDADSGRVTHNSGTVDIAGGLTLSGTKAGSGWWKMTGSGATVNVGTNITLSRNDGGADHRFIQEDGTVTVGGNIGSASGGSTYDGYAAYELSGGSLTVTGNGGFGWKSAGWTDFNQTGGTASFGSLELGAATNDPGYGRAILADAADCTVTGNMEVGEGAGAGNGGTGVVRLDGSKTGAGTDMAITGDANFRMRSTLEAIIDQAAIDNPTDMRMVDVGGDALFEAGSLLDLSFDPAATPANGTWTLLTCAGTLDDQGLALLVPASPDDWDFEFVDTDQSGEPDALQVIYSGAAAAPIPEPATMAMLALAIGGLAPAVRRRLRAAA
jgi:hypothetical protein